MILSAQTIMEYERAGAIILPFEPDQKVVRGMTYGLGPCGYDVRIAEDLELFGSDFKLVSTIELFNMPIDCMAQVCDKSSWKRKGLSVGNTIIEPGWRGHLTLELETANGGPDDMELPIRIAAGDPIAQIVFMQLDKPTDRPYNGKYQDQPAGPVEAIYEPGFEPAFDIVTDADITDEMEWK